MQLRTACPMGCPSVKSSAAESADTTSERRIVPAASGIIGSPLSNLETDPGREGERLHHHVHLAVVVLTGQQPTRSHVLGSRQLHLIGQVETIVSMGVARACTQCVLQD